MKILCYCVIYYIKIIIVSIQKKWVVVMFSWQYCYLKTHFTSAASRSVILVTRISICSLVIQTNSIYIKAQKDGDRSVRVSSVMRKLCDRTGKGAVLIRCHIPVKVNWAAKWSGHGLPLHWHPYSAPTCLVKEGLDRLGSSSLASLSVLSLRFW